MPSHVCMQNYNDAAVSKLGPAGRVLAADGRRDMATPAALGSMTGGVHRQQVGARPSSAAATRALTCWRGSPAQTSGWLLAAEVEEVGRHAGQLTFTFPAHMRMLAGKCMYACSCRAPC